MIATATASQSHSALFAADPPSSPSSPPPQIAPPRLTDSGHYLEYDYNLDADADADVHQGAPPPQQASPSPSQQPSSSGPAAPAPAPAPAAAPAGSAAAQYSHQHQPHHLQHHQDHHQPHHQSLQPLQPQPQPQAQAQPQAQSHPQPRDYHRHQRHPHPYHQQQQQQQQSNLSTAAGTAATTTIAAGPATMSAERDRSRMFVRALYEYSTDDSTSLSFRAGDVIQVLKQLDSGWWDGIVNGQRGWFPSNYCVLVAPGDQNGVLLSDDSDGDDDGDDVDDDDDHDHDPDHVHVHAHDHDHDDHDHDADADDDDHDSYGSYDDGSHSSSDSDHGLASPGLPMEGTNLGKNDVPGLWVPQATPLGRLFYFNLETAETRRELPLEAPTSATESGPRERSRSIPDQTRPPPELLAPPSTSTPTVAGAPEGEAMIAVVFGDEDDSRPLPHDASYESVSDEAAGGWVVLDSADGVTAAHGNGNAFNGKGVDGYGEANDGGTATEKRDSSSGSSSDGVSPMAAPNSVFTETSRTQQAAAASSLHPSPNSVPASAAAAAAPADGAKRRPDMGLGPLKLRTSATFEYFRDRSQPTPESWDELLDKTGVAVERFRRVITNNKHEQFSQRAGQIADWLCLVIASGSGTTDTHSVQPSVIARKKELLPHFRHFMAAFSKLILSSSVASTDCGPPDTEAKCLAEADEVLVGLAGYAEVAKEITGERIPRIRPGFLKGSKLSEGWRLLAAGGGSSLPGSPASPQSPRNVPPQAQQQHSSPPPPVVAEQLSAPLPPPPPPPLPPPSGNKPGHLDSALVEAMEKLDAIMRPAMVKLETALVCEQRLITANQQQTLGTSVVQAAQKVFEAMGQYFCLLNGITVLPQASSSPTLVDFEIQKQRLRDSYGELAVAAMHVTAPLADEWTNRGGGETLEGRFISVRQCLRDVEGGIRSLNFTTQLLVGELERETAKGFGDSRLNQPADLSPGARTAAATGHRRDSSWQPRHPRAPSIAAVAAVGTIGGGATGSQAATQNVAQPTVTRLLGEQQQSQHPSPPSREVLKYMQCDYDNEIVYGAKGQVKGGTLVALVERLTRHDMLDSSFNTTFLLTYPSFTNSGELFTQLTKRFTMQPMAGIQGEDYDYWVERKQRLVRMRVLSILKLWLESNWMENNDNEAKQVLKSMHKFAKDVMLPVLPGTSQILLLIETRLRGQEPENKRLVLTMSQPPPPPILPRNMRRLKFLDIDPFEFARQLTIIEAKSYSKLRVVECLSKGWSKQPSSGAKDPAENIRSIIMQSNQLTNWVAEMILTQQEARKRVVVIKHFIGVAEKCRLLNNFSTLTAILAALQTASIHRLKRTWEHVPAKSQVTLEGLNRLMGASMNFAEYREMLHVVNPPCVPFLGVYLKDLTFVADGNDDFIRGTELINFGKRVKAANIISEIQQYQAVPYPLTTVPELQDYIISSMQSARDVNDMYSTSLALEPREREDEKIARLLTESGFL